MFGAELHIPHCLNWAVFNQVHSPHRQSSSSPMIVTVSPFCGPMVKLHMSHFFESKALTHSHSGQRHRFEGVEVISASPEAKPEVRMPEASWPEVPEASSAASSEVRLAVRLGFYSRKRETQMPKSKAEITA